MAASDRNGATAKILIRRRDYRELGLRRSIGGEDEQDRDWAWRPAHQGIGDRPRPRVSLVQAMMRKGEITSLCERGVNEDAGRYRLTFFHKSRLFRLVVDGTGTVIQRSIVDFGDRPLPASIRNLRTAQCARLGAMPWP